MTKLIDSRVCQGIMTHLLRFFLRGSGGFINFFYDRGFLVDPPLAMSDYVIPPTFFVLSLLLSHIKQNEKSNEKKIIVAENRH